jgi:hypothetical protein
MLSGDQLISRSRPSLHGSSVVLPPGQLSNVALASLRLPAVSVWVWQQGLLGCALFLLLKMLTARDQASTESSCALC